MKPTNINRLIENKGKPVGECQKVIGSLESLYALSDFWERYASDVQLIATNELLDYIEDIDRKFNSEQVDAFKEGLGAIPVFLQQCWEERQRIEAEKLK